VKANFIWWTRSLSRRQRADSDGQGDANSDSGCSCKIILFETNIRL